MNKNLRSVAAWRESCNHQSDRERAAFRVKRLREFIAIYDALIDAEGWITTHDVMLAAGCCMRQARRLMYVFDAAGYVDLKRPPGFGEPSRMRISRKTVVP